MNTEPKNNPSPRNFLVKLIFAHLALLVLFLLVGWLAAGRL
jgi:hypothetical protein